MDKETREFQPNTVVRHFKRKWYMILCEAENTETGEQMIVYQALYDNNKVWARPKSMFLEKVDHTKYPDVEQEYRFETIQEILDSSGETLIYTIRLRDIAYGSKDNSLVRLSIAFRELEG